MEDLLYVVTVLVAFAALAGFIRLCDRLVGSPEVGASATAGSEAGEERGR